MSPLSSYFTHDENETTRRYAFLVEAVVWGPAWWRLLNYIAFGARLNADSFRCIVLSLSLNAHAMSRLPRAYGGISVGDTYP